MNTLLDSVITALHLIWDLDSTLWSVVVRSVAVSATACLLAYALGVALGAWLAVARFAGRSAVLLVLNTLLALPSVVVGLLVYLLLSRAGPLGAFGLLFTPPAMVIAQTILVLPVIAANRVAWSLASTLGLAMAIGLASAALGLGISAAPARQR